ncbi:MAG: MBL fold metallo-hydrolase, partial [Candidatus Omnitrophica bacterium]|nr:MBL fold metallo-hydrolase [Candidatus Omnitrophota bacterium]
TPGSSCFLTEKYLFSGDTLFKDGIGRTDFPYSSFGMLKDSLQNKIFPLPDDIFVYPGHGRDTTIGYEKKYNPVWSY